MGGNGRRTVRQGTIGPQRIRFSVPREDAALWSWIEAQEHLSASLCFLMAEAARTCGCVDVVRSGFRGSGSKEIPTIPAWPYMTTEQQAKIYRELREGIGADLAAMLARQQAEAPMAPAAQQPTQQPMEQPQSPPAREAAPEKRPEAPAAPKPDAGDPLDGGRTGGQAKRRNRDALKSLLV